MDASEHLNKMLKIQFNNYFNGGATATSIITSLTIGLEEEIARAKRGGPELVKMGCLTQGFLDAEIKAMEDLANAISAYKVAIQSAITLDNRLKDEERNRSSKPDSEKSPDEKWYAKLDLNWKRPEGGWADEQ